MLIGYKILSNKMEHILAVLETLMYQPKKNMNTT